MSKQAYLSTTPRLTVGKSSDGWRLPAPRAYRPSEVLSKLPPLVATAHGISAASTLDFMAGQGIRRCLSLPCREPPGTYSPPFLAPCYRWTIDHRILASFSPRQIMARLLMWLMLITMAAVTYLMLVYSVFKVQQRQKKTSHSICG